MQCPNLSVIWAFLLGSLATQSKAYPAPAWPMYVQAPRDYSDDDYSTYYQPPKQQYYYDAPAKHTSEVYGKLPYPYYYDTYPMHYADEDPVRQDERLAALPVGQETWYESETEPNWRSSDMDDVNAAFLDNLILTQMAQDAQRRREYNRNSQAQYANSFDERAMEDEDVRELKALASKPLPHHTPKAAPKFEYQDYPYPGEDDTFINWNGNKRSVVTTSTPAPTHKPKEGQDEIMVPRPASTHQHKAHANVDNNDAVYDQITKLLENKAKYGLDMQKAKSRKMNKRFIATDRDVVAELRGLKHRIHT